MFTATPPILSLRTPRTLLREWRDSDLVPFGEMSADPEVMRHFPAQLGPEECAMFLERTRAHFERHGFGLWAVELPGEEPFAGYVGLSVPAWETRFTPCVEIGWRLAARCWNRGLATEAARAVLGAAFERIGLNEVVSFTVPDNLPSRRVMEKLGLKRDLAGDFDHPRLPEGHRLRRHVLYRITRDEWRAGKG